MKVIKAGTVKTLNQRLRYKILEKFQGPAKVVYSLLIHLTI